ncbi:hypothetical protein IMZ48_15765 [Candidatus Bathyarchaeota archaeon]|nr:hypothetical protein [Candidatus Bathyarchaeota archaeon]
MTPPTVKQAQTCTEKPFPYLSRHANFQSPGSSNHQQHHLRKPTQNLNITTFTTSSNLD